MTKARDLSKLLSTSNGKIAGSNLDVSFENISDTGTEGTKIASGTTAQRGSTTGQIRFNTTTGLAEYYDGAFFKSIDAPPIVSSINPTSLGQSVLGSSQSIVITGSGFSNTVTVKIIGNDETVYTPALTTRNSATQITITTPTNLTHTNEPYDIKVTNSSDLSATLADTLSINDTPVFATASGSLGTLIDANRASSNLTPISFSDEESTPTVSVTTGSIPAGLTLNSNGTFSGTATAVVSNTTSTFTVTATDGSETATRDYSITVNAPITISYLSVAGGGGGVGQYQSGGGGAGGMLTGTFTALLGTTYTATIGGGGAGGSSAGVVGGDNGVNSTIAGSGITTITSIGGGGGANYSGTVVGKSGGSGGGITCGGGQPYTGGTGTAGQGNNGGNITGAYGSAPYTGSGGGGAGAVGVDGANSGLGTGGAGLASSITGSSVIYAGGGGGSRYTSGYSGYGLGGTGGGGNGGADRDGYSGTAGTANLGGGGGSSKNGDAGNSGGSGVVIFSVPTASYSGTTTGSPTISTSGTNTIIKFTGTGTYTG